MFIHRSLFPVALVLAGTITADLMAQTPRRILALTRNTPLLAQVDFPGCSAPEICNPTLPATAAPTWSGGTAHDPRDRATYLTNGGMLVKVDPRSGTCTTECGPVAFPALGAGEYVTGLAFSLSNEELFASTTFNRIVRYDASGGGCSLAFVTACVPGPIPTNHVISGLATDDFSNRIFWATAPWLGSSSTPFAKIYYASQATPCTVICQSPLQDCAGNFLFQCTGLAYDGCSRELYATDGDSIHSSNNPAFCFRDVTDCCSTASSLGGERIIGLGVLPSTEVSSGTPCVLGAMPPCAAWHSLGGDPVLGNLSDFSLDLTGAPALSWAFISFNLGGCAPGDDYGILCEDVPLSLLPGAWFLPTGGSVGCTGSYSFDLPIPAAPVLCGLTLSTRYWGFAGGVTNNFVSNCLTWTITST